MKHTHSLRWMLLAFSPLLWTACDSNSSSGEGATFDTVHAEMPIPISLTEFPASTDFPKAQLNMGNVTATKVGDDSVKLSFQFKVANYELKAQTPDASGMQCNNSKDGQHIHFVLDNAPYKALYEPKTEVTLAKNTEHLLVAFLSRSYHQSLKNKEAALIYRFKIDDAGKLSVLETPKTPVLTYSRPKGDYIGKDIDNLLLDFYVWNASLGNDYGVKVHLTADLVDTSFVLKEWKSYFLKNIPEGEATIKLTLVDKNGEKVAGEATEVSRTIHLAKEEPMK